MSLLVGDLGRKSTRASLDKDFVQSSTHEQVPDILLCLESSHNRATLSRFFTALQNTEKV